MATSGDQMGLVDRLKNFAEMIMAQKLFGDLFTKEIHVFKEKFGPKFKNYEEILADTSYVFTNSNPYLDYPRPMLHKTVPIGGIAVHIDPKKNELSKKWDSILNERNTTVLVSFGSVAKAIYMPDEYKACLKQRLYGNTKPKAPNSCSARECSRSALTKSNSADPRLTAFITHGGLGSTTELAHLGKPAILTRNAHMLAKHGGGIVLSKLALEHPQMLTKALKKIFNDASFSHNAKRLSQMLLNQPISAKQLLVRHCEFAANKAIPESGMSIAVTKKFSKYGKYVWKKTMMTDPRLTAFITHGGLGSTTELAHLGKPVILVSCSKTLLINVIHIVRHFTDKHVNNCCRIPKCPYASQARGGIILNKFALEHPQVLKTFLKRIFDEASFSNNAKRLSEMLLNQPISAKQLLRYSEFAAKFGRLPNLDPYGRQLPFIAYY
ncbi:hypothetical protein COOONC_10861, partial [Cooperia oncophora]